MTIDLWGIRRGRYINLYDRRTTITIKNMTCKRGKWSLVHKSKSAKMNSWMSAMIANSRHVVSKIKTSAQTVYMMKTISMETSSFLAFSMKWSKADWLSYSASYFSMITMMSSKWSKVRWTKFMKLWIKRSSKWWRLRSKWSAASWRIYWIRTISKYLIRVSSKWSIAYWRIKWS